MDQKLLDQIPTPQEMQARPNIVTTAEELLTSILRVMNRPITPFGSLRVPLKYMPSDSTMLEVLHAFQSKGYTAYYTENKVTNDLFIQWDTGDTYTLTEEDFVEYEVVSGRKVAELVATSESGLTLSNDKSITMDPAKKYVIVELEEEGK